MHRHVFYNASSVWPCVLPRSCHDSFILPLYLPWLLPCQLSIAMLLAMHLAMQSLYCHASCHASYYAPCRASCHLPVWSCISRHSHLIALSDAKQCKVSHHEKFCKRRQVDAILSTMPGASTPGTWQWRLCINHTRVGGMEMSKAPTGQKGVRFKQKVLKFALNRVAASASTPGLVVGDLNLTKDQVQEVAVTAECLAANIRFHGGEGVAAFVRCLLPCILQSR